MNFIKTTALPVQDLCKCSGGLSRVSGINLNVNCSLADEICITEGVCGTAAIRGKYYRRVVNSTTTLSFDISDLFNVGFVDPEPISIELTHAAPINFANPINFVSCKATYGTDSTCSSCTPCNNALGFKFDCSNISVVKLGSFLNFKLPKIDQCIGLPNSS